MFARRLTTILPAMTLGKALETTRRHYVAVPTGGRTALVETPQPRRCGEEGDDSLRL
jgi:predicted ATPase with chaperone activity